MIGRTNACGGVGGTIQLNKPTNLSISGTTLTWNAVGGAEKYQVYKDGIAFGSLVNTNSISLASITATGTYLMQVVAKATGKEDSLFSDGIYYIKSKLVAPKNLSRSGNYLEWSSVLHATSYSVYCDELSQSWTTNTNSIEMASKITSTGTYHLSVKAKASGYVDSDYSQDYGWQGGVQTFSVIVRRADSEGLDISVNGTTIGPDDSATFTQNVGQTLSLSVTFYPPLTEVGDARTYSYSSSEHTKGETHISGYNNVYETLNFTGNDVLDIIYNLD